MWHIFCRILILGLYQLARLDLPIYITTSPFSLLELALTAVGKKPRAQICSWNQRAAASPAMDPASRPQSKIAAILEQHFNDADLRTISFDLDIDYENLAGDVKAIKVIELVEYLSRRGRLGELLATIQKERPNVDLSALPIPGGISLPGAGQPGYTLVSGSDYDPTLEEPLVYHLHGLDIEPSSLVLTEDDYLDFLVRISRDQEILPFTIREALVDNSLLLLGYDLQDWDFRVLFRGLITAKRGTRRGMNIAIQLEPKSRKYLSEAKRYLRDYFDDLQFKVYWGNPEGFLSDLSSKMGGNQ